MHVCAYVHVCVCVHARVRAHFRRQFSDFPRERIYDFNYWVQKRPMRKIDLCFVFFFSFSNFLLRALQTTQAVAHVGKDMLDLHVSLDTACLTLDVGRCMDTAAGHEP